MNKKLLSLVLFICVVGTLTLTACNNEKEPEVDTTTAPVEITTTTTTQKEEGPDKTIVIDGTVETEPTEEPLVIGKETNKTTTSQKVTTTKKTTTTKKETTIKTTTQKVTHENGTYATAGPGNTGYSDAEGIWSPRY